MARKKAARRAATMKRRRKAASSRSARSAKARSRKAPAARASRKKATRNQKAAGRRRRKTAPRSASRGAVKAAPRRKAIARRPAPARKPRLDRERRILAEEREEHGPPSSLNLDRRGSSAARTGRDEQNERRRDHATFTPGITAGDPDVDVENAYFSGEEAPGGDNPTPDQDVVDEIGQALGVQYQDNEELRGSEKVSERDRHRWEFDPASSEDYRDRNNER
jgi:hypothetical protein